MNSYNPAPDNTDEILALIDLLPGDLAEPLRTLRPLDQLLEIVIDIGRPPLARYTTGDIFLVLATAYTDHDTVVIWFLDEAGNVVKGFVSANDLADQFLLDD